MADITEIEVRVTESGLETAERNLIRLEQGFTRTQARVVAFDAALNLAQRTVSAGVTVFGAAIRSAAEQQRASAALTAQLQAQGRFTAELSDALHAQSEALQQVTTFSDDTVLSAQAILATFPRLSNEAIPRVTEAAADLAAAFNIDLPEAARTLGIALNDPGEALTRLSRIGVRFTDDQRQVIERFLETGDVAKAQALVLDEVTSRFGGRAKAAAETFSGSLKQLSNDFDDLLEEIGNTVVKSGAVQTGFDGVKGALRTLTEQTKDYVDANRDVIDQQIDAFFDGLPGRLTSAAEGAGRLAANVGTMVDNLGPLFSFVADHPEIALALFGAQFGPGGFVAGAATGGFLAFQRAAPSLAEQDTFNRTERDAQARFRLDARAQGLNESDPAVRADIQRRAREFAEASLRDARTRTFLEQESILPGTTLGNRPLATPEQREAAAAFAESSVNTGLVFDPLGRVVGAQSIENPDFNQIGVDILRRSTSPRGSGGRGGGGGGRTTDQDKAVDDFARKVTEETRSPFEEFTDFRAKLEEAFAAGKISADTFNRALGQAVDELQNGSEAAKAMEAAIKADRDAGVQLYDQTRSAAEKYRAEAERINDLARGGFIDADTQARALKDLKGEFDATAQAMRDSVRPAEALQRALEEINKAAAEHPDILTPAVKADVIKKTVDDFGKDADDGFEALIDATRQFGKNFTQTLSEGLAGGRIEWRAVLESFVTDVNEVLLQKLVTDPLIGILEESVINPLKGFVRRRVAGGGDNADEAPAGGGSLAGDGGGSLDTSGLLGFLGEAGLSLIGKKGEDGGFDFGKLIKDLGADFSGLIDTIGKNFTTLFNSLGGFLTNLFADLFGGGGFDVAAFFTAVGIGAAKGAVGAAAGGGSGADFGDVTAGSSSTAALPHRGGLIDAILAQQASVRRFHFGGVAALYHQGGVRRGEVPAILEEGELVIPRNLTREIMALSHRRPEIRRFHTGGLVGARDEESGSLLNTMRDLAKPTTRPMLGAVERLVGGGAKAGSVETHHHTPIQLTLTAVNHDPRTTIQVLKENARTIAGVVVQEIRRGGDLASEVGQRQGL